MTRRITTCLTRLARRRGPLARREHAARAAIGMPRRHPERITAELPGHLEDWLAAVAASMWPGDEYAEIIHDTRPDSAGDGH